jgi:hypothetical protein
MISKNTKLYANYYLLLEEYIKKFNDYEFLQNHAGLFQSPSIRTK